MKNTSTFKVLRSIWYVLWLYQLLLFFPLSTAGQSHSFRTITISEGLTHNTVNAIFRDSRGFIWLGTQTGLDRFDGINITNYTQFKGQTIFSIAETDSIFLWIGTDNGLIKFNRKTESLEHFKLTDKPLNVKCVFKNKNGKLFVASDRGLYLFKDGAFHQILLDVNALSLTNNVLGVIDGEGNTIWVITDNGLVHYNITTNKFVIYKNTIRGGLNSFSCLVKMGDFIYLGTSDQGMLSFNIKSKSFALYPKVGNGCINALVPVAKDVLYIGTNGSGIKIVEATTGKELSSIEHSTKEGDICSNAIYSLLKYENILYVGTYMGGLSYTPTCNNTFSVYSYSSLFNSYNMNVRAFYIDTQGKKVIGTRDGLYYISEKRHLVRNYTSKSSILRSNIILFVKPLDGNYLIGTYGGGLYLLHSETGELSFFKLDNSFKQDSFTECEQDRDGKFWISSSDGVYMYDSSINKYKKYDSRNSSLSCKSIFTVKVDSKDRIWFGASGAVFMYDKVARTFKSDMFPEHILPYTKSIRYIFEDREKNLWFCDDKAGVVKANQNFTEFKHFTADDFLPNNSISSIVNEFQDSGLWLASQCGLMYIKNGSHKLFSMYDGLPSYIFNNSVQVTNEGIWWGNDHGLVHYVPQLKPKQSLAPLPIAITEISVAGRVLHAGDKIMPNSSVFTNKIVIPFNENNITFTFSALNYSIKNTDMYEYCLEGYDKGWKTLINGNQVNYTDLPIGNYVFKVRAASSPNTIKSVEVKVARSITYKAWLFLISFCVCLVLLYFYYVLLRRYRKMKLNIQERAKRLTDLNEEKYQKSKIENEEVARIKIKLDTCMNKDKMYLRPDLKLQDVAKAIGCNVGDLSQVLNSYLNINFTDYINQYRVEEFMLRIRDKSAAKYTLTSLSEQCGFSSRTSFFRSFKKFKSKSPAEYIKEKGIILQ